MKRVLFLIIINLMFLSNSYAMINYISLIDKALDANPNRPFNGVFLTAKGKEILYQKAQAEYGDLKIDSQFLIGGLKEQFIATAFMQLADKKIINIDKKIKYYLPSYNTAQSNKISIRMILSHEYEGSDGRWILIEILKRITGKSIQVIIEELFEQAGMLDSVFIANPNLQEVYASYPRLVHGHEEIDGSIMPVLSLNDHYNIISTVSDLLKWNLALHKGKLISARSYQLMTSITNKKAYSGYGLGVNLLYKNDKDKELEISSRSYIKGYMSSLVYYPKSSISVIVLENTSWDKQNFKVHDEIKNIMSTVSSLSNFYSFSR